MDNYEARYGYYDIEGYQDCEADDDKAQVVEIPVQVYHGLLKAEEIVRRRACQQVKKSEVDDHGYKFLSAEKKYVKDKKAYCWKITKLTPYSIDIGIEEVKGIVLNDLRSFYNYYKDAMFVDDLLKCKTDEERLQKIDSEFTKYARDGLTKAYNWMQTHGDRVLYELSRIRYNYQLGLFEITYLANDII